MISFTAWQKAIVVSLSLLLMGCGGARAYKTHAVYDALVNGYQIDITTQGQLPWGKDINPIQIGTVVIGPLSSTDRPKIQLDIVSEHEAKVRIGSAEPVLVAWGRDSIETTLRRLLLEAGYKLTSADEVAESAQAIEAALLGPKTTLMPGQTKALKVKRVTFQ